MNHRKSFSGPGAATAAGLLALTVAVSGCSGGATVDEDVAGAAAGPVEGSLTAGYVSAIDQLGLPLASELGLFEEQGLEVTVADPFPTGVDAINALQAGEVDIIQVGVPGEAAIAEGDDLVFVGNYSGSAVQRSVDDTLAVVAAEDSGIDPEDLSTLAGATFGVSVGSINHLYLLGLLKDLRIDIADVELVNTAPPDMAVALETGGVDAVVGWDPAPILALDQVKGSYEVVRGGGYIPYIGYIATTSTYLQEHPDLVQAFLTARAGADQWIRQNPQEAAESATRWLTGTDLDVAQAAMEHNIAQLDPRFSACNYLAADTVALLLEEQEVLAYGFDLNDHIDPSLILAVQEDHPDLFSDLPQIPDDAQIDPGYTFLREVAQNSCAV